MNAEGKSLRRLIEKWLAPTPTYPVRLTRYGRAKPNQSRFVLVQASGSATPIAIYFFQHDDGAWWVFPPAPKCPAMHV
ncbi:hypothetical protein [Paraburkholderia sp. 35.1]|uniref:hypothetical protein n=1 Tax=Paraburkholderia sp. 35.1 TaxID=2991058 RepID=UPI003D1D20F7